MQFSIAAMLGFGLLAAAVPVEKRTESSGVCCSKGSTSSCSSCDSPSQCPSGSDYYASCSYDTQVGLVDLLVCDVLNDITLDIPISVSVPISAPISL